MSEEIQGLAETIRTWAGHQNVTGQIAAVDVTVWSQEYSGMAHTIGLFETPASELGTLLHEDIQVRTGDAPPQHDPYALLRYVASRLTELLNPPAWRTPPARGLPDPGDDAEALLLLAAAVSSIDEIAAEVAEVAGRELRGGRVTTSVLRSDSQALTALSQHLESDARQLRSLLGGSAQNLLARLQQNIGSLRRTASLGLGDAVDGGSLRDQFVLRCHLSFWGLYHVRIFERPDEGPVVILGELGDNHAGNITNKLEALTRLIATHFLHDFDVDCIAWIQYEPAELVNWHADDDGAESLHGSDTAAWVSFEDPASHAGPTWVYIDPGDLAGVIGCSVRRWHARDYTSAQIRRDGVRLVTIPTS